MTENQQSVIAEITHAARVRCQAIGGGTLEAVEALRAELEKSPALGHPAGSAADGMRLYTTRLEATATRPALTVT
ncbi:hypothetical protein [Streptomyces sp. NPDC021356]|uniref:hypothetical protein n=1 Tax=Streptomyces sp. NPDC021356 TaxID=3154900 RepID=UPI0033C2953B